MRSAAQPVLSFGAVPDGWPAEWSNPANVVCVEASVVDGALRCDRLAGRTYTLVGSSPTSTTDETQAAAVVHTIYTSADVESYLASTNSPFASGVGREAVTVTGHAGVRFRDGGRDVVVWQEADGVIGAVAVGPVETAEFSDPLTVAGQVRPSPFNTSTLALVAASLDRPTSDVPSGAEVVYRVIDGAACVGIGWIGLDEEPRCLGDSPLVWVSGTVPPPPGEGERPADLDAVGGLVDSTVRTVTITEDGGATITIPTVPVPGTAIRAWGTRLDRTQGTPFTGVINAHDDQGRTVASAPIAFVRTINSTERFCFLPGTTGIAPDVVGLAVYDAAAALIDVGLTTARAIEAPAAAIVTGQNPTAGTDVGCGDVVLTYSVVNGAPD